MNIVFPWLQGINSFFKRTKADVAASTVTRRSRKDSQPVDFTESYQSNIALTRGLYFNTYQGFKLAGGLAYPPIAVPVQFMGLPIVAPIDPADENTAEELAGLVENYRNEIENIHTQCHRDGTVWIWPHWDSRSSRLIWEFITDDTVTDIVRDLNTGEIVEIMTSENLKITTGIDTIVQCTRNRRFSKSKIEITYKIDQGILPQNLRSRSSRNPLGVLPIAFANNSDAQEVRGHSDYERIISDLKNYHDIDLARVTMLAKFNPKMVQTVTDVDAWTQGQGVASIDDLDISKIDLIVNLENEKTEFIFPERVTEPYRQALIQIFQKLAEAMRLPEIVWGLKTPGNNASVEESMATLVKYVQNKQAQKNNAYNALFSASLKILRAVRMGGSDSPAIKITWNDLDGVSEQGKSAIFAQFASGVAALVGAGAITQTQLYKFWRQLYPNVTADIGIDKFKKELAEIAQHNQYNSAGYSEALDFQAKSENDTE